jgi:hypothetical protein
MRKSYKLFTRLLSHYSFHNLLVWLLVYLVAGPFITGKHTQIILSVSISLVLFFAVYAINNRSKLFKYVQVLMGMTLVIYWLSIFKIVAFSNIASKMIIIVYMALLIYAFSKYVFMARKVTTRLISAALCLYLLMGALWGFIYDLLDTLAPGSYKGDLLATAVDIPTRLQHFEYFSFVTLTTLGYGDILPQTEGAAALCQTEAIIGQFFMAVLVARLVGIQVSQEISGETDD